MKLYGGELSSTERAGTRDYERWEEIPIASKGVKLRVNGHYEASDNHQRKKKVDNASPEGLRLKGKGVPFHPITEEGDRNLHKGGELEAEGGGNPWEAPGEGGLAPDWV